MTDKVILITGASSGLGEATAFLLAESGYLVFAGVRTQLDHDRISDLKIDNLRPVFLDVTKEKDIDNVFNLIEATLEGRGLMALINNAGNNYCAPTEYFDEQQARLLLETHFWGMAKLIKKFLPSLRLYAGTNPSGARIINVGSVGSISGFPFIQFYNAAKFAVLGFTESLRLELEPYGIKTIVILPGAVKSSIWKKTDESVKESIHGLDDTGRTLYLHNINQANMMSSSIETHSVGADDAAKIFKKALEDSKPALKYFIGADAKSVSFMVRFLPDTLRLKIVRAQLKFQP